MNSAIFFFSFWFFFLYCEHHEALYYPHVTTGFYFISKHYVFKIYNIVSKLICWYNTDLLQKQLKTTSCWTCVKSVICCNMYINKTLCLLYIIVIHKKIKYACKLVNRLAVLLTLWCIWPCLMIIMCFVITVVICWGVTFAIFAMYQT